MRDLIDLIKNLECSNEPTDIHMTTAPEDTKEVQDAVQDAVAQANHELGGELDVVVSADTVTGRSDSDNVHYVGDQEADVSQNRRNNIRKYGRKFQI